MYTNDFFASNAKDPIETYIPQNQFKINSVTAPDSIHRHLDVLKKVAPPLYIKAFWGSAEIDFNN